MKEGASKTALAAKPIAAAALLAGAAILLPALRLSFSADDWIFVEILRFDGAGALLSNMSSLMSGAYFRPAAATFWSLDYLLWGTGPLGYHLTNLFIHAANAALLGLALARMTGSRAAGFFCAALFWNCPAQAEAVFWVSGRFDLLAAMFGLGALVVFLGAGKPAGNGPAGSGPAGLGQVGLIRGAVVGGLCLLSLCSKETGAALAAVIFGLALLGPAGGANRREDAGGGAGKGTMSGLRRASAPAAAVAAYLLFRIAALGGLAPDPAGAGISAVPANLAVALSHLFKPLWPGASHGLALASHALPALYVALAAAGLGSARGRKAVLTGMGLLAAALAPALLFPWEASEWTGSRTLYLPAAGLCMAAGSGFALVGQDFAGKKWLHLRTGLLAAAVLVLAVSAAMTRQNLVAFRIADGHVRSVLEEARPAGGAPWPEEVCVMDLPQSIGGVMLFLKDNALSAALTIEASRNGPRTRVEGYHAGWLGPLEYSSRYPRAERLRDGSARLLDWDLDGQSLGDVTADLVRAMRRREESRKLGSAPPIELARGGYLRLLRPRGRLDAEGEGYRTLGSGGYFESTLLGIDAVLVDSLKIEMAQSPDAGGAAGFGQVYFINGPGKAYSRERSVLFKTRPGGGQNIYRIELGGEPRFLLSGKLVQLRIDPMLRPGRVRLESVTIEPVNNNR